MADLEVLALNESTPRIEAAQSGDRYLARREIVAMAGMVGDAQSGTLYQAIRFNSIWHGAVSLFERTTALLSAGANVGTYGTIVCIHGSVPLVWTTGQNNTVDLALFKDAADTLAQRRGTNAQAHRVYNTFTDASNYERLGISWSGNVCTITTQAAGTGTLRGLRLGGSSTDLLGFWGATATTRPTAVADATDAASVITQLNALLSRLRTIGLIAS